jgi:hypothetical protein
MRERAPFRLLRLVYFDGLTNGRELRIHVVEEVEKDCFGGRRFHRRPELLLAVVAQDQMLQAQQELGRKAGDLDCMFAKYTQADCNVTD